MSQDPNKPDPKDQTLSALYQQASREQTSETLDQAVLQMAQQLHKPKRPVNPFTNHWTIPMSMAAVLVLSVSLIIGIDRESPELIYREPVPVPVPEKITIDSPAVETEQVDGNDNTRLPASAETFESEKAPQARDTHVKQKSAAKPKPASTMDLLEKRQTLKQAPVKPEKRFAKTVPDRAGTGSNTPGIGTETEASSLQQMQTKQPEQTNGKAARKPDQEPGFQKPGFQKPEPRKQLESSIAAPRTETKLRRQAEALPFADEVAELEQIPSEAEPAEEMAPESAMAMEQAPSFLEAPRLRSKKEISGTQDVLNCSKLPQTLCLESRHCNLELQGGNYICRAAQNTCEQDFVQANAAQNQCESKPGCRFKPARCYCPPKVQCVCGGGPPPACLPE